jgi:methyl coenzyme M reductase subunit D
VADQAASKVEHRTEQYIQLTQEITIVVGQRFAVGEVMVISTVNARRPGEHVDNVYGVCGEWFNYITTEQAEPIIRKQAAERDAAKLARDKAELEKRYAGVPVKAPAAIVTQVEEDDPLAGLGLE